MLLPGCCYRAIATTWLQVDIDPCFSAILRKRRKPDRFAGCGRTHPPIVAPHCERSKHCWRRLTISHSAPSHFSHSDVPGLKLATSQVAATRWSAYGTTVTCEAPPHCGAARNLASTKVSSSVLVFGNLSLMVFYGALDEPFIARHSLLKRDSAFFGRKRVAGGPLADIRFAERAPAAPSQETQNGLERAMGRRASSRRLGLGISPSRWACFRAAFRARRIASAFSRFLRSDGFS
jgi:hypothetical protein